MPDLVITLIIKTILLSTKRIEVVYKVVDFVIGIYTDIAEDLDLLKLVLIDDETWVYGDGIVRKALAKTGKRTVKCGRSSNRFL